MPYYGFSTVAFSHAGAMTEPLHPGRAQEIDHHTNRVLRSLGFEEEAFAAVPGEAAFGRAAEDVGGFEEAQAGEHLARVAQVDGDFPPAHHAPPLSSFRDAC